MAWMAGVTPRLDTCLAADCFAKALVCDVIRSFEIVEQEVSFEQVIRTTVCSRGSSDVWTLHTQ